MQKQQTNFKKIIPNIKKTAVICAGVLILAVAVFVGIKLYEKYYGPLAFLRSLDDSQQVAIGKFIGDAYQNIYGIKAVCKTEDIVLEKYPKAYREAMADELEVLNKILAKDDLNLEAAIYLFLPYNEMQLTNNFLYREMRSIADSEESGIKSSCIMFEEQADTIAVEAAKISKEKYSNKIKAILE